MFQLPAEELGELGFVLVSPGREDGVGRDLLEPQVPQPAKSQGIIVPEPAQAVATAAPEPRPFEGQRGGLMRRPEAHPAGAERALAKMLGDGVDGQRDPRDRERHGDADGLEVGREHRPAHERQHHERAQRDHRAHPPQPRQRAPGRHLPVQEPERGVEPGDDEEADAQAALVPLSIGLMGASGLILALTSDRSWVAGLITVSAAVLAFATRLNPLWMLLAGGALGFAGLI